MDDLISRKAAIDATEDPVIKGYVMNALKNVPSIPAVPIDKLCEWMENDCILSCLSCEHLFGGQWCKQHPELPYRCNRKEHWKEVLTKRMEGWMRLIDGDALSKETGKLWSEMPDGEELSKELMKAINHAPTIDATPMKHGKWEEPEPEGVMTWDKRAYAQCSLCKKKSYLGWKDKYCRYCGSKNLEG